MNKNLFHIFLFASFFAISFVSCDNNKPTNVPNFQQAWKLMNAYISDNYKEGDTLLFTTKENQTDTFVVTLSQSLLLTTGRDINETEDEDKECLVTDTINVQSTVILQGNDVHLEVTLLQNKETAYAVCKIYKETMNSFLPQKVNLAELPNDYIFTNSLGQSCHIRKGEGIIDFSDENGHTWTKQ